MEINIEFVKRVSEVSRLKIKDEESHLYVKDFENILSLFEVLNELNTDKVEPSFHPIKIENPLREDLPMDSKTQDETLSNVKKKKDGFILGPRQ